MKITGADGLEYTIKPNAGLEGADLSGANLEGTHLTNLEYNDETIWPEDFELLDSK
jgi:uncharacterized protein YjbI with pentapeptide repeats